MIDAASRMRSRVLLRRFVVATVALGVFGGLAGGAAIGLWGVSRRTATSFERMVAYEGAAEVGLMACPDGVTPETPEYEQACANYDYADILGFVADVPGVESVGRYAMALAGVAKAEHPEQWQRALLGLPIDVSAVGPLGRPIVVEGRLYDPNAPDEATIDEEMSFKYGIELGDWLVITPYPVSEFDAAGEGVTPPGGTPTNVRVVGITRRHGDLAGRLDGDSVYEDGSTIDVGPGWWNAIDGEIARYGVGLVFEVDDSTTRMAVIDAITSNWPDRMVQVEGAPGSDNEGETTVVDAISLQALGIGLVAIVVGLAGLVFVGQAIARQTRREWADADVLVALGMNGPAMARATALRMLPTTAVAIVVAFATSVAVSPFGPIGIGRAAEPHPGVHIDWLVLAIGLPGLAAIMLGSACLSVRPRRRRDRGTATLAPPPLPPTGAVGWTLTTSRSSGGWALGSAVIGVALAAATAVAAWSIVTSYDALVDQPAYYGSAWDAQVGNVGSAAQGEATLATLAGIDGIRAVGIISTTGIGELDDHTLLAFEPALGDVNAAVIVEGRPPAAVDEIALGGTTMEMLDTSIGETVNLPTDEGDELTFTVVGRSVINDGISAIGGKGALVTNTAFDQLAPGNRSQSYAVWIDRTADRTATLAEVEQAFPTTYAEPHPPQQVRNIGLLSRQPALLALIVGLLAGGALIHALVTSVRRQRRQLAILKSIGFTRGQVATSVAVHATLIAGMALLIGIPIGIATGRLVWTAIINDLGVGGGPVITWASIVAVALFVLVVSNVAALGPAVTAARRSPVRALRSE